MTSRFSIALIALTLVAATGCEGAPASNPNEEPAQVETNAGAATPKAEEPKADAPAEKTTLAVTSLKVAVLCAEFTGPDAAKAIPSLPADTDAPSMNRLFASRADVAKVFGACTAPAADAFDFTTNHVAYVRTQTCNEFDGFEGLELDAKTLTIVAKRNTKEIHCENLGHSWLQVPAVEREVLVRVVD